MPSRPPTSSSMSKHSTHSNGNGNLHYNQNGIVATNSSVNGDIERSSNYTPSFHHHHQQHHHHQPTQSQSTTANGTSSYTTTGGDTRFSSNTSFSSLDTAALSLADVEANRARFVRLTQDFQKIHETTPSIEEEGGGGGKEGSQKAAGSISMRSPIELSDDGSDDSGIGTFEDSHTDDMVDSPRPLADVPQDIPDASTKRRSRSLSNQTSTPILSPPPRPKRAPRTAISHETLNGTTRVPSDVTHETHLSTAERRPLTLATAATISVTTFAKSGSNGSGRRILGLGTGMGIGREEFVDEMGRRPFTASAVTEVKRPSALALLMKRGNQSSASLSSPRLGGFPEPPISPPPASPLPSVPSSFAAQQKEAIRRNASGGGGGGGGEEHYLSPNNVSTPTGFIRRPSKEKSKTLPPFPITSVSLPSSPGPFSPYSSIREPPPLPDKSEERANAEAVALLKEHAINVKSPTTTEVVSTKTRGGKSGHGHHKRDQNATPVPSMIQSGVGVSEDEYDLADYRSLRSTKKKRRLSDLSTWASVVPVPIAMSAQGPVPPTPNINLFPGGAGAYSVRSVGTTVKARDGNETAGGGNVWEDLEFALKSIINPRVFRDFVRDPLGRHRFREYLIQEGNGDTVDLDLWVDLSYATRSMGEIRSGAQAVYDLYLSPSASNHVNLPSELQQELLRTLRPYLQLGGLGFESTQQHLLERMYAGSFQRFMRYKIIQECAVRLGKHNLPDAEQEGLGDCFCLTNPRLPDHPVVLVTDGFVAVTGYPRQEIVGRNCRFLQGPGTSPQAVQRIRDGLNSGEGCTELLLNYRRNGEPFYCLLCIIPLRDASGAIAYFIGGQTNVTGIMSGNKNLGFLLGAGELKNGEKPLKSKMSPTMQRYKQEKDDARDVDTTTIHSRKARTLAAGSQLPLSESSLAVGSLTPRATSSHGTFEGSSPFVRGANFVVNASRFLRVGKSSSGIPADGGPKPVDSRKQLIAGAEATLTGNARALEDQMNLFKDLYQQVVIFKKERREITFVTKQLLAFLGLPRMTKRDLYCSALIHADLLAILTGHDKTQTRQIRKEVKRAILRDEALSIPCGFKFLGKGKIRGAAKHKFGVLHMTPLKDLDNNVVAFVGIFA